MQTKKPSNNWINEAGIINAHLYNQLRSETNRINHLKLIVDNQKDNVKNAASKYEESCAQTALRAAAREIVKMMEISK